MIKKQILEGRFVKEVESNLGEIQELIEKHLQLDSVVKQVFETCMSKGMSLHSVNEIKVYDIETDNFNNNFIVNINNSKFSIAINEECSITIERPQGVEKLRLFFNDFQMWLSIN